MPLTGNCCKSKTTKPHLIDPEPSKSPELSPIQSSDGDHDVDHDLPTERGCPKIEPCPNAVEIPRVSAKAFIYSNRIPNFDFGREMKRRKATVI